MPDDRFLHKRAGHSDKFAMLTDFEWRVWCQYMMSADDFGVMRLSGLTLQEANDALARRPLERLEACLHALVTVRLLNTFEHQRKLFLYQWDWQDWQKVKFPRKTILPKPPLDLCSRHSRWLLQFWPGGIELKSWKAPEQWEPQTLEPAPVDALSEDLANAREQVHHNFEAPLAFSRLPLAVSHEPLAVKPSAATISQVVSKSPKSGSAEKAPSGVREFLTWFQAEYKARRNGATYFVKWEAHGKLVKELLRVHDIERLKKLATILLKTNEDWTTGTDRGIGILSTKINWLEERLCAWETERKAREAV